MLASISIWIVGLMTALKIPLLIAVSIAGIRKMLVLGIWGIVWAVVLFLAWDIITPPYVVDLEGAVALLVAPLMAGAFGITTTTAFIITLGIIYIIAAAIVIFSFWFF